MWTYTQEFCDKKDKHSDKCFFLFLCKLGTEKNIDSFGLCSDPKCYPKCFTIQNVPPLERFCHWFQKLRVGLAGWQLFQHLWVPPRAQLRVLIMVLRRWIFIASTSRRRLQSWGWNSRDAPPNFKHHLLDRAKLFMTCPRLQPVVTSLIWFFQGFVEIIMI